MGLAAIVVANFSFLKEENIVPFLGLTVLFYSVAEILIAPFVLSYITRLSDVRYSSTIVGFFMFMPVIGNKIAGIVSEQMVSSGSFQILISISIISIIIGLLLFFFRKIILKMSGGID